MNFRDDFEYKKKKNEKMKKRSIRFKIRKRKVDQNDRFYSDEKRW